MEKLKKKRGVVRSASTRLINEMTTAMNQLPAQQGELEDKISLLTLKEKSLRELDTLIADLVDENNIEEEMEASLAYEDSISIARSRALRELQKLQPKDNETTSSASNTASRSEGQGMSGATVPNVRLPKLELPKFNGDLAEWQTFWDQFQSSIDQNPVLSPVDKLKYLKVHLVGRAEAVIKGIPVTGDNYDTAIELLKKRFGQPSVIVNDHLTHLLNIKSIATSAAVDELRKLYDDVVTRMRSLKSLGVDWDSYGVLLHTVLQKSLPSELILRYSRSLIVEKRPQSEDKNELGRLLEFIDIEVETREKCRQLTPNTSQRPTPDAHRLERHSERGGSAAALTTATKPELRRCVFCSSKEHNLENCTAPLTIKEKKDKLKVENRCFRCTKQFHRSRECRSAHKLSCAKCSGKHLTVMCDPEWAVTRQPTNASSTPPQFIGISRSSTTAHNQVLLQTAMIRASGQTETSLRALIDGGSQRTFIRRDTSERLGCRPVGEEELTLFAFGDSGRGTKRNCRRVKLVLRSHHGPAEIVVEALEVPEICGEILTLTDGDIIRNLQRQGITLADLPVGDCQGERGVSILIGADYYWRVTTGNVRRVNLSLTAVETIFGWSLQGPINVSNAASVCLTTTFFKIDDDDEPPRFSHGDTPARPIRDDRKPYEDEKPKVRFDNCRYTPARPIKGDRDPYDFSPAGRSLSTSSAVDFYGRTVQVLTGEKAHQPEELLRRKYEKAQRRKASEQDILVEEARGRPEEKAPIRFDPPPRDDNEPITSRPFDYFGKPVQVYTGEKAAHAEALLRKQYERVQSRMRESKRLQEARRPPEKQTFHRQPKMPQRGDIPLRKRGDREDVTRESKRHLVTSRPYDYFARPFQVLTYEKAAQVEGILRRQYKQYQHHLNGRRDRNQEEAYGRPVELERRPVQPHSGEVTSSPVDHFGRPVQVLSGEKAGKQTELLRRMYERAESSRSIQELGRRPVEEVYRSPRQHKHKHRHGQEQAMDYGSSRESRGPAAEGTSGRLRLSKEEMMSKLTPDVRESYLKDLRKARMNEETDPVRANQFLTWYQNTWKSRASQHTKSLDKEPANDALNEDNVDDKDDYDGSYDQTCLHDRKQGTSLLSAPKVKHAYVYKYKRKVLTRPPISKNIGNHFGRRWRTTVSSPIPTHQIQ